MTALCNHRVEKFYALISSRFDNIKETPSFGLSTTSLEGMSMGLDGSDTENRKRRNKLANTILISSIPYFCPAHYNFTLDPFS